MTHPPSPAGAVGLIGVGLMGQGIAGCLLRRGYRLTMLEHPGNQPLDALIAAGARTARTPAELAREADTLILCVTGSPQVEAVLTEPQGALAGLRPDAVIIDCSTSVPATTIAMAERARAAGGHLIDAAMTRTPKEAAEGRLNLLVGAEPTLLARVRPVLETFAENILHAGPVGSGHRMKLLHNFVSLGSVALIAEAAACALEAGIEPATFVEVLARGGGGGTALERLKPSLLGGEAALRFSIANAAKDLQYFCAMAQAQGIDHRIAASVRASLEAACSEGDPNAFVTTMVERIGSRGHLAATSGLKED
jgi:3-hydroxyisobutyrate dehydrogenase-like beta-hydroxyacid dehydrogenase